MTYVPDVSHLGPLGFLVFDDGENRIEGNQGLKDQQLALEWVKDNIKNFGGDESRVCQHR